MGKKSNLSGLRRFLPQEFLDPSTTSLPDASQASHAKKRKTETIGPGRTRYDASTLVPHYRVADEVPENLQKCSSRY
jgi:trimethylguanosine synthase